MLRRRLMEQSIPNGFVDLGLPSGTLWARGNICKDTDGKYSIGEETDYGAYFSWGNIVGHNDDEGYLFTDLAYNSSPGRSLTADIDSNDAAHDAALACLGSPWHLATKGHFDELCNYTDLEWTTIDGVTGTKFMKKTDHSIYVFFPAAGYIDHYALRNRGSLGEYWLSTLYTNGNAFQVRVYETTPIVSVHTYFPRQYGFQIRPIIGSSDWITDSYEESLSVEFYNSLQDSYYGDSGNTYYDHTDIPCNMEFDALLQSVNTYSSGRKEYTTLDNVSITATSMDINASVNFSGSYYYVDGYMRLYSDELPDGWVDFKITSDDQDYNEGDDTYYFNIENDNGDVVGSGSVFFLESGYAGIEITHN